jgi:GNAT superfamily N-acetyltransferase
MSAAKVDKIQKGRAMALSTWWQGDSLPHLAALPELTVAVDSDGDRLAKLTNLTPAEVNARLDAGNRAYVAAIAGEPAAYGWVATITADIGELELGFSLPATDRYLWDFVTLEHYRGRGIYPRLLQAIIRSESVGASRFWIIHAPENSASGAGIRKAGFTAVSSLSFTRELRPGAATSTPDQRAQAGAALLGLPLLDAASEDRVIAPCWRCVLAGKYRSESAAPCWPLDGSPPGACHCVVPTGIAA